MKNGKGLSHSSVRAPTAHSGAQYVLGLFAALFDLNHLEIQAGGEVVEPAGHIHVISPHTLDRPIKGRQIAVIKNKKAEESFEIIALK